LAFKSAGNANKISAKEALTSYFPKYKNTLEGNIEADWNISGLLYPEIVRMKALKGSAKIKAVDGALRSIDFQETISSSMQKIPFLKNVKTPKIDSGFKTMTATIAFKDGVINVDPMQITGRGNGLDIKGKAKIQENLEHESFFDIYDSHSVLPKEISKGANAASVALRFTGPISAPKPDYEYSLKKLASSSGKDAAKNLLKKALGGDEKGGDDPLKSLGDKLKKKIKFF